MEENVQLGFQLEPPQEQPPQPQAQQAEEKPAPVESPVDLNNLEWVRGLPFDVETWHGLIVSAKAKGRRPVMFYAPSSSRAKPDTLMGIPVEYSLSENNLVLSSDYDKATLNTEGQ